jgi:allantoate deiminase
LPPHLCADPAAPRILIGSHYDTVHDGGKYDGALGIIAGIAAVKALLLEAVLAKGIVSVAELEQAAAATTAGQSLNLSQLLPAGSANAQHLLATPVHVVAFSDEEGVRFQSTFLGSRAVAGSLDTGMLEAADADGMTVRQALEQAGFDPSPAALSSAMLRPEQLQAYVEVHLEQGPVLEAAGQRLGAVAAIAGQSRLLVEIVGEQGHAGTVPMRSRRDPLEAAAELMGQLERLCNGGGHPQPTK